MICRVCEITGQFAIASDSGQRLYDLIHPELKAGKAVKLDFTGVRVYASAFFNFAIGQILRDVTVDDFNRLLTFTAISPLGENVLERVIENAKPYYSDPKYRQAVDTVLEEYAASF
jgi:hypothetical protein